MSSFTSYIKNVGRAILGKQANRSPKTNVDSSNFCPVCQTNTSFNRLAPFYFDQYFENEFVYSPFLFETLNIKEYSCKQCGASDRDRLMALYLLDYFSKEGEKISALDFAPAVALAEFLKQQNIIYRSADLYMDNVDDKIDIRDMHPYEDNRFDLFICSHVLEHIDEDQKAMNELFRITKPGGVGLCMVPIMLSLEESVEDPEYLKSESLRWKYFGQADHVRMYSKNDFSGRLKNAGFLVNEYGIEHFGKDVFERSGIDRKSILYVVQKPL